MTYAGNFQKGTINKKIENEQEKSIIGTYYKSLKYILKYRDNFSGDKDSKMWQHKGYTGYRDNMTTDEFKSYILKMHAFNKL
jgi:hypothetical protein